MSSVRLTFAARWICIARWIMNKTIKKMLLLCLIIGCSCVLSVNTVKAETIAETLNAEEVEEDSAVLIGKVNKNGGFEYAGYGFWIKEASQSDKSYQDVGWQSGHIDSGAEYEYRVDGLEPGTEYEYYFYAVSKNDEWGIDGTVYGERVRFETEDAEEEIDEECPHRRTDHYYDRTEMRNTGSSNTHEIRDLYDLVCKDCGEVLDTGINNGWEEKTHEFDGDECACGYQKAEDDKESESEQPICYHARTDHYYDRTEMRNTGSSNIHEIRDLYDLVCKDCGEVLDTGINNGWEEQAHEFDGDECACGYQKAEDDKEPESEQPICYHARTDHYYDRTEIRGTGSADTHEIQHLFNLICKDCGEVLETGINNGWEEQAHEFDGDKCACGYCRDGSTQYIDESIPAPSICDHLRTDHYYDRTEVRSTGSADTHEIRHLFNLVCKDCGEVLETGINNGWEEQAHEFDGDECACGYQKAEDDKEPESEQPICYHTRTDHYYDRTEVRSTGSADTHEIRQIFNLACMDCGEVLETGINNGWEEQAHEFDGDICVCGYCKDGSTQYTDENIPAPSICDHQQTDHYYDRTEVRSTGSIETHEIRHLFNLVCKTCGDVLEVDISNGWEVQEHVFDGDECACGYREGTDKNESPSYAFPEKSQLSNYRADGSIFAQYYGDEETVWIPEGFTQIGGQSISYTFQESGCKTLYIPKSVTDVKVGFAMASKIENIYVDGENPNFKSVDGVLFTKDGKGLVQYPPARTGTAHKQYRVPEGTEEIWTEAFATSRNIESVILPEGLKSIGLRSFAGCWALREVYIPASTELIGGYGNTQECFAYAHEDFRIVGYADTAAEEYAQQNNLRFQTIDGSAADPAVVNASIDGFNVIPDSVLVGEEVQLEGQVYGGSYYLKKIQVSVFTDDSCAHGYYDVSKEFSYRDKVTEYDLSAFADAAIREHFVCNAHGKQEELPEGNAQVYVYVSVYDTDGGDGQNSFGSSAYDSVWVKRETNKGAYLDLLFDDVLQDTTTRRLDVPVDIYGGFGTPITVDSNMDWSVTTDASWIRLTADKQNNQILHEYETNHTGASRVGTITVSAPNCADWVIACTQDTVQLTWNMGISGSYVKIQVAGGAMNPNHEYTACVYRDGSNMCLKEVKLEKALSELHYYDDLGLVRGTTYHVEVVEKEADGTALCTSDLGTFKLTLYAALSNIRSGSVDVTNTKEITAGDDISVDWDGSLGLEAHVYAVINGTTLEIGRGIADKAAATGTLSASQYLPLLTSERTKIEIWIEVESLKVPWEGTIVQKAKPTADTYEVVYRVKETSAENAFTAAANNQINLSLMPDAAQTLLVGISARINGEAEWLQGGEGGYKYVSHNPDVLNFVGASAKVTKAGAANVDFVNSTGKALTSFTVNVTNTSIANSYVVKYRIAETSAENDFSTAMSNQINLMLTPGVQQTLMVGISAQINGKSEWLQGGKDGYRYVSHNPDVLKFDGASAKIIKAGTADIEFRDSTDKVLATFKVNVITSGQNQNYSVTVTFTNDQGQNITFNPSDSKLSSGTTSFSAWDIFTYRSSVDVFIDVTDQSGKKIKVANNWDSAKAGDLYWDVSGALRSTTDQGKYYVENSYGQTGTGNETRVARCNLYRRGANGVFDNVLLKECSFTVHWDYEGRYTLQSADIYANFSMPNSEPNAYALCGDDGKAKVKFYAYDIVQRVQYEIGKITHTGTWIPDFEMYIDGKKKGGDTAYLARGKHTVELRRFGDRTDRISLWVVDSIPQSINIKDRYRLCIVAVKNGVIMDPVSAVGYEKYDVGIYNSYDATEHFFTQYPEVKFGVFDTYMDSVCAGEAYRDMNTHISFEVRYVEDRESYCPGDYVKLDPRETNLYAPETCTIQLFANGVQIDELRIGVDVYPYTPERPTFGEVVETGVSTLISNLLMIGCVGFETAFDVATGELNAGKTATLLYLTKEYVEINNDAYKDYILEDVVFQNERKAALWGPIIGILTDAGIGKISQVNEPLSLKDAVEEAAGYIERTGGLIAEAHSLDDTSKIKYIIVGNVILKYVDADVGEKVKLLALADEDTTIKEGDVVYTINSEDAYAYIAKSGLYEKEEQEDFEVGSVLYINPNAPTGESQLSYRKIVAEDDESTYSIVTLE